MLVQPYLFFDGRCEEAIAFYKSALGAEVEMLMHFKDAPVPPRDDECGPTPPDKVMHASIRIGETTVMASDGRCQGNPVFQGFSLAITTKTVADADRVFAALQDGGRVEMPLDKTFFSPRFGMVTDRFGIGWMVVAAE